MLFLANATGVLAKPCGPVKMVLSRPWANAARWRFSTRARFTDGSVSVGGGGGAGGKGGGDGARGLDMHMAYFARLRDRR